MKTAHYKALTVVIFKWEWNICSYYEVLIYYKFTKSWTSLQAANRFIWPPFPRGFQQLTGHYPPLTSAILPNSLLNATSQEGEIKEGSSQGFTDLTQSFHVGIPEICRGQQSFCELSQGNTKPHKAGHGMSVYERWFHWCTRRNPPDQWLGSKVCYYPSALNFGVLHLCEYLDHADVTLLGWECGVSRLTLSTCHCNYSQH